MPLNDAYKPRYTYPLTADNPTSKDTDCSQISLVAKCASQIYGASLAQGREMDPREAADRAIDLLVVLGVVTAKFA